MRKIALISLVLVAYTFSSLTANDIIAAKDLFKVMNKSEVVIVSAQTAAEYQKVHIKNAVHINHKDLYKEDGPKYMLKSSSELAKIFGEKGISEQKTIVVYDQGTGKYAGRVYWILKYMGCSDVQILDGQLKAWMGARKPITKNPSTVKATSFTPAVKSSEIASMTEVKSGKHLIIDVRATSEYNGSEGETERKGHIPGAKNIEYKKFLNDDATLKTAEEINALMKGVGASADKSIILYCTSSVRAGIVYAALKSVAGYTKVKVYDGAFYEWEANGNKVE